MKKRASLFLLFFLILIVSPQLHGEKIPFNPGEVYDASINLYYSGKYEEAIQGFSRIIQFTPYSRLVSYCQYMIGLCYFKMGKYEEALQQLEFYVRTYPEGDRIVDAEKYIRMTKEKWSEANSSLSSGNESILSETPSEKKRVKRRICAQIPFWGARSLDEVEKSVKGLKEAGVDTIILKVFRNKGDPPYPFSKVHHEEGVYFKTEYAPVVDDLLGKMAGIIHRNGLDLFAWMTTRYANLGLDDRPEYRCKQYDFETKRIRVARGVSLFHPEMIRRLEGLFRDLGRYPIDGILFQDDLILKHNEDFSPEANQAFLKEFGYLPHPDLFYLSPYPSESGKYYVKAYTEKFLIWANWKNRWLMNLSKRLMGAARESNPNLQFAINLYFEAVLNELNGLAWFSQTLSKALETKFDYYAVMAYHRQAMKDRKIGLKEAIGLMTDVTQRAIDVVGNPSQVLMKMWILNWKSNHSVSTVPAPQKEIEEILQAILKQGEVSIAFVPYIDQFPIHRYKPFLLSSGGKERREE